MGLILIDPIDSFLQLGQHQRMLTGICAADTLQRVGLQKRLQSVGLERQQGRQKMPAVTTHQTMLDQRQVHQLRLNICRRYVFATRSNEQVFFTTRHIQVAISIKMTQVTAVQPAVYQGLRRLVGSPQIALKDVRSMDQDLTVVSDAHLRSRQWLAYRTDAGTADQADGSRSAIFGLAVNLADHQIKTSKELQCFRRNRRGGRDQQTRLFL